MKQPSLRINFLYRAFYEILMLITPFITAPYISRVLGADGVGIYSYTLSIITYFTMLAALGTNNYGTREIARSRKDRKAMSKLFWEIEIMTIITSGICLCIWILVIVFSVTYKYYFLALTPLLLGTMFDISWLFTGLERVKNIVVRNSLVRVLGIILLFALVKKKEDILLYCIINSGTALLGSLTMWFCLPGIIVSVDFKTLELKNHFRETLIYFIPTIATSVYTILDKTLIGVITGNSYQNGYYEQATKIISMAKGLVFGAVNAVMGARMSYLFSERRYEEIMTRIRRSLDFIIFLAIGSIFGLIGVSRTFVPFFFGKGYEPVEYLIYLMAPLILIIGVSNCLGNQYFTPSGKRAQSAKYIIIGAIVNLVLNMCFIPFFQSQGAVISSLIAELCITSLYLRNCEGYLTVRVITSLTWKRIIVGSVMALAVFNIGQMWPTSLLTIIVQVGIGVSIYVMLLWMIRDRMVYEIIDIITNRFKKVLK